MRLPLLLSATAVLSACMAAPPQQQVRSPQAQQELDRYLAGKVAGPAQACLSRSEADDMIVIDDDTILFRDGRRYWRTEMRGSCSGLSNGRYALVTRQFGSGQLCRGEVAQVVDTYGPFTAGSCVFGDFVPYSPPGR